MKPLQNYAPVSLADAERRYKNVAATIMEAYDALNETPTAQVTPRQLHAGIEQFLTTSKRLESSGSRPDPQEVTRLGDYGITLLTDLSAWAQRLDVLDAEAEFDLVVLGFAEWTTRHAGELHTIEPLVDAFANLANRLREPEPLERLTQLMTRVIRATAPGARIGMGQAFPARPWRLLNLNYGIVATRTRNTALMEEAFDELVRNLPDDAREFFAEGMQQVDALDYPVPVRAVMIRYFDRWTRSRMH